MSTRKSPGTVIGYIVDGVGQVAVMAWAATETDGALMVLLWIFVCLIVIGWAARAAR